MRGFERAITALLLGPTAAYALDTLASSVLFTTVRINTGICSTTAGVNGSSGSGNGGSGGSGGSNGSGGENGVESSVSTDYGSYHFLGFYPLPDQGTLLKRSSDDSFTSDDMTLELCGNFCDDSTYFAIQDGDTCSCNNDGPTTTPVQTAYPLIPCAGDKTEVCGASGYAVVYAKDTGSGGSASSASGGGAETIVVTGVTSDSAGVHPFTSTEVISSGGGGSPSSGSGGGAVTVVVTGITTDTEGVHTFTSTEVVSSVATTAVTGVTTAVITATSGAPASSTGNGGESSDNGAASTGTVGTSSSAGTGGSSSTAGASSISGAGASSSTGGATSGASSSGAGTSSSAGGSATTSNGNTASSSSASPSSSSTNSATYPCPDSDGQAVDVDGTTYIIQCGTDYVGNPDTNDLTNPDASTFSECLDFCSNYVPSSFVANGAPCVAVTFGIGGTNSCYLKFEVEEVEEGQPGYDSAYKQSYSPPNAFTTGQTNTATTGSTNTAATGGSSTATTGGSSTATTGSSTAATEVSSTSTTGSTDTAGSSSTATTSSSSTDSTGGTSTSATGGTSVTSAAPAESTVAGIATCPADNNTVLVDTFGYAYYVKCGVEVVGMNLYDVHADSFERCLRYCDLRDGCAGVTYEDGAAALQANCFPYAEFKGYNTTTNPNLYSGIPQNGTSTGYPDAQGNACTDPGQGDGNPYYDVTGRKYTIGCDKNLPGTDLLAYVADDLDDCATYCSLYDTCIAVDWTSAPITNTQANCYPKSANTTVEAQTGTSFAYYDGK